MKKISYQRIGEYLKTALAIVVEHDGAWPIREIIKEMDKRIDFDDYEKHIYEASGYVRWQSVLHFFSIDVTKAGWLKKHKGIWYITDDGRKALEKYDAEKFVLEAGKKYKEWAESRDLLGAKEETEKSGLSSPYIALEQAQATANENIKSYIRNLNSYQFQDLVAALFRGMGYYTPFVAPKGPDGGIDIIAYKDPIGAETPRIRIQVKHRTDTKVNRGEIDALSGALHREGYIGVIVSSGGFSSDAETEIRVANKHIEKINLDRFIDLWEDYYDKLSEEDKNLLPLQRVSFLASEN